MKMSNFRVLKPVSVAICCSLGDSQLRSLDFIQKGHILRLENLATLSVCIEFSDESEFHELLGEDWVVCIFEIEPHEIPCLLAPEWIPNI